MADDTANGSLTAKDLDIRDLNDTINRLRRKMSETKAQLQTVTKERDEFAQFIKTSQAEHKTEVETLAAAVEEAKTAAAASPDEWKAKYEAAAASIRERTHKDAFAKVAKGLNVLDDAIDDAWTLSGYKPESDAVDETAMAEKLAPLVKGKAWLLKPATDVASANGSATQAAPTGKNAPITLPASKAGPGAVRGVTETSKPLATVEDQINAAFAATGRTDSQRI